MIDEENRISTPLRKGISSVDGNNGALARSQRIWHDFAGVESFATREAGSVASWQSVAGGEPASTWDTCMACTLAVKPLWLGMVNGRAKLRRLVTSTKRNSRKQRRRALPAVLEKKLPNEDVLCMCGL